MPTAPMTPGNKLICTQELDLYKQRAVPDWTGHKFCPEKKKLLQNRPIMKCKTMQVDKGKRMLREKKNKLLATSREGMS